MGQDRINDIINRLDVEGIKPEERDTFFIGGMRKRLMEKALEGELASHPGCVKYERNSGSNSHNGKSRKTIKTEKGAITIDVPRDRNGNLDPLPVRKGQTGSGILDHQVIALYGIVVKVRDGQRIITSPFVSFPASAFRAGKNHRGFG